MNVTETLSHGLRREFRVVVNAQSLDQMLNTKLAEMQPRLSLKGFRPGKAPLSHLKRTFGKSILGDIVNETVSEQSQRAVSDRGLRTAMQPQIKLDSEMEQVLNGHADLIFNVAVDLMPEFQPSDLSDLTLTRPVTEVSEDDVDSAIKRMAEQQRTYEPKTVDPEGAQGDQLIVDFEGRIDGALFDGGTAENARIVLGSGTSLPGFEEQLLGASAGDLRTVNLTFPPDYSAAQLAGKDAVFTVTVKEVLQPVESAIDDSLAQKLGLEDLDKLRAAIRGQMSQDFLQASRTHLKRAMLDALDARHSFDLPAAMVDAEFAQIWAQVDKDLKAGNMPEEDKNKSEDELKAEFRKISERRVRLGLLLSEIGRINNIQVAQDEINRSIVAQARQYPGQEQKVLEFYRNNAEAMAQLRAPIFEEKVIDFLCTQIKINDQVVSREELFMDPDDLAPKLAIA